MLKYVRIADGDDLVGLEASKPSKSFKAIVVIEDEVSPAWRARVSEWLVEAGCLFMMAWGKDCSLWDDSVDDAKLEKFNYGDIPEDKFVFTTWHDDEPLAEVLHFAKYSVANPWFDLGDALIVHIGQNDRGAEFEAAYENA